MDINKSYFYMPFGPIFELDLKKIGLESSIEGSYYQNSTKSTWRKTLLYNTGWGQPYGFERLPELSFDSLLCLALQSDPKTTELTIFEEESNKYGAIAVIMQRHMDELIDYLFENIDKTELFRNELFKRNLTLFCFDGSRSLGNGGIGNKTYAELLNASDKWRSISRRITDQVYK